MTVNVTVPEKIEGVGTGSVFDFPFSPMVIYASTDMTVTHVVISTGVETPLTEGTGASNYSVTVSEYPGAGHVTYPADESTAMTTDEKIVMKPVYPLEQQTRLNTQGGYDPTVQETTFDKIVRLIKQVYEEVTRSIKFVVSADLTSFDVELPDPASNGGRIFRINSGATGFEWIDASALGTVVISDTDPLVDGVADPGTSLEVSRADHVHPLASAVVETLTNKTLDDFSNDVHANAVHVQVRNVTGSSIAKGKAVYVSGASGQTPTIALADSSSEATSSHTIGLTTEVIANNATGQVLLGGIAENLDTSAFLDGDTLYLDTVAGGLTATKPATPEHLVVIGHVAYAHATQGKIFIAVQNGWELGEIHDVLITSVSDNDLLQYNSAGGYWENVPEGSFAGAYSPGFIYGLTLSNNGVDADHDIDITSGSCRDADDTANIELSAITKAFDATFVEGTGNGGFAAGESLPTSGTIHIWAIAKDDGTADVFANDHATSGLTPTLPTGFTKKRRIGSRRTDASANILGFIQVGDEVRLKTPVLDQDNTTLSTTAVSYTVTVPSGIEVEALVTGTGAEAGVFSVYISDPDSVDIAPIADVYSSTGTPGQIVGRGATSGDPVGGAATLKIRTDTAQVRARASSTLTRFKLITHGWTDRRGA